MATVLDIAKKVAKRVGMSVPDGIAASTLREHVELLEVIHDAVEFILDAAYWQKLMAVATITGDGSTTEHALPSNYHRMEDGGQIWTSELETSLTRILSRDDWLSMEVQDFSFLTNAWILYGGQIIIKPALASGVTAKYFYQRNDPVQETSGGSRKSAFTADTDEYLLDSRLLTLCATWKWKEQKGMAYQEDMASYEERKASLITHDKGARTIRVGSGRARHGATTAYPKTLG